MRKRPLGTTGLEVSELALGTWGLSGDGYGPVVEAETDRTIDRAIATGITLFDTSDAYGRGAMEKKLGERLPKTGVVVATRLGTNRDLPQARKIFTELYLREAFERSAARLGRPADVVLLHNPTAAALDEGLAALRALKQKHGVRAIGVSAGSAEVALAALGGGIDVLELVYNVFLAGDLHAVAGQVASTGTGVLARSVLLHGLLAGHWTADREFYPGDHRADRWRRDELRKRVAQLEVVRPLVAGAVVSLRSAALRFVLANQLVSSAVLGPRSVAQLEQLVREAGSSPPYLKDQALTDLGARLRDAGIES